MTTDLISRLRSLARGGPSEDGGCMKCGKRVEGKGSR